MRQKTGFILCHFGHFLSVKVIRRYNVGRFLIRFLCESYTFSYLMLIQFGHNAYTIRCYQHLNTVIKLVRLRKNFVLQMKSFCTPIILDENLKVCKH